eukprot:COSAG02_NODE_835_length_16654_cov_52.747569_2_plen_115_part_00
MRLSIVQDALSTADSAAMPSEAVPSMPAAVAMPEHPTVTQAGTKDQAQVLPVAWGRVRVGATTVSEGNGDGMAGTAARAAQAHAEGEKPVHALFEPGQEPSAAAVLPPRQSMDL